MSVKLHRLANEKTEYHWHTGSMLYQRIIWYLDNCYSIPQRASASMNVHDFVL
jgi:hypothetical protein